MNSSEVDQEAPPSFQSSEDTKVKCDCIFFHTGQKRPKITERENVLRRKRNQIVAGCSNYKVMFVDYCDDGTVKCCSVQF